MVKAGKGKTSGDLKQANTLQTALRASRIKTTAVRRHADSQGMDPLCDGEKSLPCGPFPVHQ